MTAGWRVVERACPPGGPRGPHVSMVGAPPPRPRFRAGPGTYTLYIWGPDLDFQGEVSLDILTKPIWEEKNVFT